MSNIEAILIDSREPTWVQKLQFGGIPTTVMQLETGDLHAVTSDGSLLVIERKTPEDLLNTLREDRLFPQIARMAELRLDAQLAGKLTTWPYLCVTDSIYHGANGKAVTGDRGQTGWDYASIQGTLLSVQEMGVFVVTCAGDGDYESCILRLGARKRDPEMRVLPPRAPNVLGPGAAILASLPGIGVERVMELLRQGGTPAMVISGLTDLEMTIPAIPMATRKKIRATLGLKDKQQFELFINGLGDETMKVLEEVGG